MSRQNIKTAVLCSVLILPFYRNIQKEANYFLADLVVTLRFMRNLLAILLLFLLTSTANAQLPKRYGKLYDIGEAPKVVQIVDDNQALIETDTGAKQFLLKQPTRKLRAGKPLKNDVRYFQYLRRSIQLEGKLLEQFRAVTKIPKIRGH